MHVSYDQLVETTETQLKIMAGQLGAEPSVVATVLADPDDDGISGLLAVTKVNLWFVDCVVQCEFERAVELV